MKRRSFLAIIAVAVGLRLAPRLPTVHASDIADLPPIEEFWIQPHQYLISAYTEFGILKPKPLSAGNIIRLDGAGLPIGEYEITATMQADTFASQALSPHDQSLRIRRVYLDVPPAQASLSKLLAQAVRGKDQARVDELMKEYKRLKPISREGLECEMFTTDEDGSH